LISGSLKPTRPKIAVTLDHDLAVPPIRKVAALRLHTVQHATALRSRAAAARSARRRHSCPAVQSAARHCDKCIVSEAEVIESEPLHIIIADDHPLFRDALRLTLETRLSTATVQAAGSLDEAAKLIGSCEVDLVLLDLTMPGVQGLSGLLYLRAQFPSVPVVVISASEDRSIARKCIAFGAAGFVPKSANAAAINEAIDKVLSGGLFLPAEMEGEDDPDHDVEALAARLSALTPQQVKVLMMLSQGLLNKQIAYELSVSEATVKAHVSAILTKLGVESRTQAVILAARIGGILPT
jgi:DNA-binding NarL/FixJ family response regulator